MAVELVEQQRKIRLPQQTFRRADRLRDPYARARPESPYPSRRLLLMHAIRRGLPLLRQQLAESAGGHPPALDLPSEAATEQHKVRLPAELLTEADGLRAGYHTRWPADLYPSRQRILLHAVELGLHELEARYLPPPEAMAS